MLFLYLETTKNKAFVSTKKTWGHRAVLPQADYVDAVLQQHPDIDQAFNKVCKLLAKCQLNGTEKPLQIKFIEKMEAAVEQQRAGGQKAAWFHVDYKEKDDME